MKRHRHQTYDFICFTDLVYEFSFPDKERIEKKIKRRLKYYGLGAYDQERINYIRQLKNDLYSEITKAGRSKYHKRTHIAFSALADFDDRHIVDDYHVVYSNIDKKELLAMIHFAIYIFYLR